jgi:hypothetical protein
VKTLFGLKDGGMVRGREGDGGEMIMVFMTQKEKWLIIIYVRIEKADVLLPFEFFQVEIMIVRLRWKISS